MITWKNILNRWPSQPWISFACCRARKKKYDYNMTTATDACRSRCMTSSTVFEVFPFTLLNLNFFSAFFGFCLDGSLTSTVGRAALLHAHIHFVFVPPTPLFFPANLFTIESAEHMKKKNLNLCLYACCFRLCRWFTHQFRQGERAN